MMRSTLAIAGNTMREARRNKIFYSIFFFALVIILSSFLVTEFTIHFFDRILRNVGAGAIGIFGVLLAIFLGVGMVSREVDRRTVYTVVTKPIHRSEFIIGKFLGLMGILIVSLGVMLICFLGVLAVFSIEPVPVKALLWHFALTQVKLAVVVAFAILMSTFTTSALSAFFAVGMYVIGELLGDLTYFAQRGESAVVRAVANALYYGLPNLQRFNLTHQVTYGGAIDPGTALFAVGYGFLWVGFFLVVAMALFARRDFK